MNAFKFKARKEGEHIHLLVYVGPDLDHLAFSGRLVLNPDEYRDFIFRVLGTQGIMAIDQWEVWHLKDDYLFEWSRLAE